MSGICLIVENCLPHPPNVEMTNTRQVFFTPNTISIQRQWILVSSSVARIFVRGGELFRCFVILKSLGLLLKSIVMTQAYR